MTSQELKLLGLGPFWERSGSETCEGFGKAFVVLRKYLILEKDDEQFKEWL